MQSFPYKAYLPASDFCVKLAMPEQNKIIPVYKPPGFATFDLIRIFKKKTSFEGKIGHGGSLDPFACGVVLLLLGDATRRFEEIRSWEKQYNAGVRLGALSTTGDVSGEIKHSPSSSLSKIDRRQMEQVLRTFIGEVEQKVPSFAAAKYHGVPMYKLARKKINVEKTKTVKIYNIELINVKYPLLTLRISCSGGVYVRQLVQDIAHRIGEDGFLYYLQREKVGIYTIENCITIEEFK